jgi:hypothetical protein
VKFNIAISILGHHLPVKKPASKDTPQRFQKHTTAAFPKTYDSTTYNTGITLNHTACKS